VRFSIWNDGLAVAVTRRRIGIARKRLDRNPVVADRAADVLGDTGLGVARDQAEIDAGLGIAGQHVILVAGIEYRQRRGWCGRSPRSGRSFRTRAATAALNSHRFDSTTRVEAVHFRRQRVEHFATVRGSASAGDWSSSRTSAALSMPMAVSRGGIEECPGVACALRTSVA